jgi:hypothetical protein
MKNLLALSLLLLLVSCGEPIPRVKVSGGNPPIFTVSRTQLIYLEIYEVGEKDLPNYRDFIWKIANKFERDNEVPLEIVYGIVPEGYYQHTPKDNRQALSLIEGKQYVYEAMGNWGAKIGRFEIKGGKAVDVKYQ